MQERDEALKNNDKGSFSTPHKSAVKERKNDEDEQRLVQLQLDLNTQVSKNEKMKTALKMQDEMLTALMKQNDLLKKNLAEEEVRC